MVSGENILRIFEGTVEVTRLLTIFQSGISFTSFIYEEACQLRKAIVKAMMRCKQYDEARRQLDQYHNDLLHEALIYQYHIGGLEPITFTSFYQYFLNEYYDNLSIYNQLQKETQGLSPPSWTPPVYGWKWRSLKEDYANLRESLIDSLTV